MSKVGEPDYEASLRRKRQRSAEAAHARHKQRCDPLFAECLAKAAVLDSLFNTRKSDAARFAVNNALRLIAYTDYQGLQRLLIGLNQSIDIMVDFRQRWDETRCEHGIGVR